MHTYTYVVSDITCAIMCYSSCIIMSQYHQQPITM